LLTVCPLLELNGVLPKRFKVKPGFNVELDAKDESNDCLFDPMPTITERRRAE
jgi:hypothetical protein